MKIAITLKDKFGATSEIRATATAIYVDSHGNVNWKNSAYSRWDSAPAGMTLFGLEIWEESPHDQNIETHTVAGAM